VVSRPTGSLPKITRSARQPKGAERAADLLRDAQHLIVEAAGLLGSGPEDGGLWDAVAILVEQRETAESSTAQSVPGERTVADSL
jgi:hypothetical protein